MIRWVRVAEVLFTTKGAAENKVVIKLYGIVVTTIFVAHFASFGETAVGAVSLCG